MNKYAEPYVIAGANVIRQKRKAKRLTQHETALQCGIPLARYRAYENAMMPISLPHMQSICKFLNETMDMFVYYIYTKMIFDTDKLRDRYYINILNTLDDDD